MSPRKPTMFFFHMFRDFSLGRPHIEFYVDENEAVREKHSLSNGVCFIKALDHI